MATVKKPGPKINCMARPFKFWLAIFETSLHRIMSAHECWIVMMNPQKLTRPQYIGPARYPLNGHFRVLRVAYQAKEFMNSFAW